MIEVSGVSKTYGDVIALDDISFTIDQGQIVGLLGSNGAGKTSIMDIVSGCLGADKGEVKICGYDIGKQPVEAKSNIGYLPDEPPLYHEMTVEEYIRFCAQLRKVSKNNLQSRVDSTLDKLSLSNMKNRLIGNLSKGYKQRVGLAQAIVHNPPILILDEPTEGLDPNQIAHIRELILSLRQDHTILFSSHILSEVSSLCDSLVIVDRGTIVEQGQSDLILSKFQSSHAYELRVRQGGAALKDKLVELEGVQAVNYNPKYNSLVVEIENQSDYTDIIARTALDSGCGLEFFAKRSASLEDVFSQLTNH